MGVWDTTSDPNLRAGQSRPHALGSNSVLLPWLIRSMMAAEIIGRRRLEQIERGVLSRGR
jgi:hypothetical protein